MYSKTQKRRCCLANGLIERRPLPSTITISPGSTSRTKSAPMMSSAQVSEARIQASSELAEHERPHAQRVAHADQRLVGQQQQGIGALRPGPARRSAGRRGSSRSSGAIRWMMTSVSVVDWNRQPLRTSSLAQDGRHWSGCRCGRWRGRRIRSRRRSAGCCGPTSRRSWRSGYGRSRNSPCSRAMTACSPKMSPTRPAARWAWNWRPS